MNLLVLFIVLNIINVILQTVKSIATVKCGKVGAALINAIAYGIYTVVLVYTNSELSLAAKVGVTAATNLIGVYIVKLLEEKLRKDRLWKIEFTVNSRYADAIETELHRVSISHNSVYVGEHTIFNCYCRTQYESARTKEIIQKFNAKYFASETKLL